MTMRRVLQCLSAAFVALALAGPAEAAKITVVIDGLRSARGNLVVALYDRPDGFPDGDYSIAHVKLPAATAPQTVVFDHLRSGRYALGAYHDENGNDRFDTSLFGFPAEGYALSNGVRAIISRPRFADAAFPLTEAGTQVALHIRY